ncbi:CDT1-like protein a, chloroplastic [Typha latifolia]|uniref:CDT1-like protein a, chloroplastic n=1 Tax=Typha latifolia TaxID=4733 RepID=UPI003C2F3E0B
MEHEKCEEQTPKQSKYEKLLPGISDKNESIPSTIQKMEIDLEDPGSNIESPTPEKPESRRKANLATSLARKQPVESFQDEAVPSQSAVVGEASTLVLNADDYSSAVSDVGSRHMLNRSPRNESVELPEEYRTLKNLFNRMESSLRLLRLRKKLPTFQNICTQVEILTKRKFLCHHLAQMKYLFPEAIQIDKIRVHDLKTLCMIPEMKITLLMDVVEYTNPNESTSMALCRTFEEKLSSFITDNPEGTVIPEAMLPEPFNSGNPALLLKTVPTRSSTEQPQSFINLESSNASHLPSSFQQLISRKVIPETQQTQLLALQVLSESQCNNGEHTENRRNPQKQSSTSSFITVKSPAGLVSSPDRHILCHYTESTPAKLESNSEKVITETPAQQTPKRIVPTSQEKLVAESEEPFSEARLTSSARRSLIYSPSKTEESMTDPLVYATGQDRTLQYSHYQDVPTKRSLLGEESRRSLVNQLSVERNTAVGILGDAKMNRVSPGKCQEKLASLPSIFDTICLISQSIDCSLITRQELVHKVLSNNLDIEETGEVEEQLVMLEKLAPDWISKKPAPSGEFLYSIKKIPNLNRFTLGL